MVAKAEKEGGAMENAIARGYTKEAKIRPVLKTHRYRDKERQRRGCRTDRGGRDEGQIIATREGPAPL